MNMRVMVERIITEMDALSHPNLPTAGQLMTLIGRTRLRFLCTTPLILFALLEVSETLPSEQLRGVDTRAGLLHPWLKKRLEPGSVRPQALLYFRDAACMARCHGENDLLC